MTDETVSIDVSQGGGDAASDAYIRSWKYTAGTYGAKFVASIGVAALVAGALTSAPAVGGTVLACAVIAASANTASTATSLAMRSGYEKQIAKDVFTYKALGTLDYCDSFFSQNARNNICKELETLVNARADNDEKDSVVDKDDKYLDKIIKSGNWNKGDKQLILNKLQEKQLSEQDVESLSELYANLKLNLYDFGCKEGAKEIGISAATGVAVGLVGAGATAMWHNNFATTAARTGTASAIGTLQVGLVTAMWHNNFATTAARTGIAVASAVASAEAGAVIGTAISAEAGADVGAVGGLFSAELPHGATHTEGHGDLSTDGIGGSADSTGESFNQSQSPDLQSGADLRILTETQTAPQYSFQDTHCYWRDLEGKYDHFTDGFFKWMNEKHEDFKLYRPDDLPETLRSNDFGCPKNIRADIHSAYDDDLHEYLHEYDKKLKHDNKFDANNDQGTTLTDELKKGAVGVVAFAAAAASAAGALYLCSASKQGADETTSPSPKLHQKFKKGLVMTNATDTVRYYTIGDEFQTLSGAADKSNVANGIEDDFEKVKKHSGVILSSKVEKKEGDTDKKIISIIINNSDDQNNSEIIFHDKRIEKLKNDSEKFYFKLSYKKDSTLLTLMRDGGEIRKSDLEGDAREIFDSIEFDIIVKEGEKEKQCNFRASEKLSTGSFDWKEELAENKQAISNKSKELSDFAQASTKIDNINPNSKSPSSNPAHANIPDPQGVGCHSK